MNENCRYCKTAKTCLENAEYNSIYCHMHKRIPKIIDRTYEELQNENQQLKDKLEESEKEYDKSSIDKAIKILIYSLQCYAPCGRLKLQEREAIKLLKKYAETELEKYKS